RDGTVEVEAITGDLFHHAFRLQIARAAGPSALPQRRGPAAEPAARAVVPDFQGGVVRALQHPLPNDIRRYWGAQTLAPAEFRTPEQNVHQQEEQSDEQEPKTTPHGQGRFNVWPARRRRGLRPGLADCKASSFRPYLREIEASVSPASTLWVRDEGEAGLG